MQVMRLGVLDPTILGTAQTLAEVPLFFWCYFSSCIIRYLNLLSLLLILSGMPDVLRMIQRPVICME